ncbi:DEAD/DEAH box helicase [Labrys wisconsinensis]|uniref:ATP-dependent RNA helicase RhlE n=1 Tax=Labrys wisconsinensis TaxID=425677 RepID=A0ABU0JH55_9HYPH|nr:DEAD/DEAH box helicase [Labrys wisconsinensis]MDQ0472559.1 ATP-dependent RNA helicase RhlE [Labrys wisconsinensis]
MTDQTFTALGLAEPLLRALDAAGYHTPTPIQARAIPPLLEGRDMMGLAQTGTGKTAAFALPILQRLSAIPAGPGPKGVRALILAPTRELAVQIDESFRTYGKHVRLKTAVVFGGVGQGNQVKALSDGVDILVATPGRLLDLHQQRKVRLDKVKILVLDEADRMLDMGFSRDVLKIVDETPLERQSLLFSATMPKAIKKLGEEILLSPVHVEVTPEVVTVDKIDQHVFHVPTSVKRSLLLHLLNDPAMTRVIVFTRTKHGANRVADQLERAGVGAAAIHGNKSQNARQKALEDFRAGKVRILVATDIAARGIDVDEISHVINYELPVDAESYVHRIGRTARAGRSGVAYSFCDASEKGELKDIERLTRKPLQVAAPVQGLEADQHRDRGHRPAHQDQRPRGDRNRGARRPQRRAA